MDPGGKTAIVIIALETRYNNKIDDPPGGEIREPSFQSAPDLDANLSLLARYEKDYPVVLSLLPYLPGLRLLLRKTSSSTSP